MSHHYQPTADIDNADAGTFAREQAPACGPQPHPQPLEFMNHADTTASVISEEVQVSSDKCEALIDAGWTGFSSTAHSGGSIKPHSPLAESALPTVSSTAAVDDGTGSLCTNGTSEPALSFAPQMPADATRRYVNSVVSNIAVSMPAFDGTTNSLRMCLGAKVETQSDLKAPEGAEEFSLAWFGVARAILTTVITQDVPEKAALRASVGDDGAAPLSLSVKDARKAFASGLETIMPNVIGSGSSSVYRRYMGSRFQYSAEVEAVSKRMMEGWLAEGVLPEELQEKYRTLGNGVPGDVAVQTVQDLERILIADADAWVASFFPLYQLLKRDGVGRIKPIWADEAALQRLSMEELAYQVYALCTLKCLLKNKDGHARGVAVPKTWLQQLLAWIVATQNYIHDAERQHVEEFPLAKNAPTGPHDKNGSNEEEGSEAGGDEFRRLLRSCPGPIDTFHCVRVAPGHPAKHWLLPEDKPKVDVVPERLFDYLCLLFGSGPRYLTYGEFTLQSAFESSLKPHPLTVEVTFAWEEHAGGVRTEKTATVYVEEAVRRSDLAEVLRLAMQLVREESGFMPADKLRMFSAAVCGPNALVIHVKDINMEMLKPPMNITEDAREVTVSDVIARGTELLRQRSGTACGRFSFSSPLRAHKKEELCIEVRLLTSEAAAAFTAGGCGEEESQQGVPHRSGSDGYVVTESTVARSGVCGLTNIGNTCYMNSALQCISALRPFREDLLAFPVSKYPMASITSAYVQLLADMWSGQYDYANTKELKDAIGEKAKRFAGYQQQDANELIEVMLDRMEEEVNQVSCRSYRERLDSDKNVPLVELSQIFWDNFLENNTGCIPKAFFHQSKTVFHCLTCGETSTVFDNNLTLSLNIKEPRVKRTMRVMVLVKRPQVSLPLLDETATAAGEEEEEEGENGSSGERLSVQASVVHVNASLRVVADENNNVAASDLKAALRQYLFKSKELQAKMLSQATQSSNSASHESNGEPGSTAVSAADDNDHGNVELDYAVELLEVAEQGTTYAFANCSIKDVSAEGVTATLRTEKTPVRKDNNNNNSDPGPENAPEFRVWYFLKDGHCSSPTAYGSLVYVEDLPVVDEDAKRAVLLSMCNNFSSAALPVNPTSDNGAPCGDTAEEEEGPTATATTATTTAPPSQTTPRPPSFLSKHIIRSGKVLAGQMLKPLSDDATVGAVTPYSTDYMMVSSAAVPNDPSADAPRHPRVKVLHRKNRRTSPLDVEAASNTHGDAWLYECQPEGANAPYTARSTDPNANELFNRLSNDEETAGTKDLGGDDRNGHCKAERQPQPQPPVTNVVITLQYNGSEFDREEVPSVGGPAAHQSGWGTDFSRMYGLGEAPLNEEDEQTCTLNDCLMRAMETDTLSGDDSWYCPKCKEFRETCVQRSLFRLPPCLVVSFKRFKMVNSYYADKNNTTVSFPTSIDLAPYLDKEARAAPGLNPHTHYKLRGVVYHSGSLSFGHYTASVYNDYLEKWVYCNDVSALVEHHTVPAPNGAYILCYEQVLPSQDQKKPRHD